MDLYNTTQTWNFNNVFGLKKKKKEKKRVSNIVISVIAN